MSGPRQARAPRRQARAQRLNRKRGGSVVDDIRNDAEQPDGAARPLTPAARRALAEAEARRAQARAALPPELDGRGGLEPVRYGDWEVKGLASDF
jgi:hypothetical protein